MAFPLRRLALHKACVQRSLLRASVSPATSIPRTPCFRSLYQPLHTSAAKMESFDTPVTAVDSALLPNLPSHSATLFEAKKKKKLSFESIAKELGRDEVAVAAIFYGQAKASREDVAKLAKLLDLHGQNLEEEMYGWPDRGRSVPMPPREPLIYRLYEIVQNYGYAYKGVINEKFGDGIMSAISFSTNVKKETDEKGDWVVITLRGKWLPFTRF